MKFMYRGRHKQSGLVVILFTIALTVLLGFAALAIDVNHVVLNKSRIQNGVDAAALAGAVVADAGESQAKIATAVLQTIKNYSALDGNSDITVDQDVSLGEGSLTVKLSDEGTLRIQFSNDPTSFPGTIGSNDDTYVRVEVTDVALDSFLIGILGIGKSVSATAVAGPSSSVEQTCNLVPMAACAVDGDDSTNGGYVVGQEQELKSTSWKDNEIQSPGNFGLLDFLDDHSLLRDHLAGGYKGCLNIGDDIGVKPGGSVGNVAKGLNTRFNDDSSEEYPSDKWIGEGSYSDYEAGLASQTPASNYIADGELYRRTLQIPIIDCSKGSGSGNNYSAPVVTIGCFFMKKPAPTNNSGDEGVIAEFRPNCLVNNASFGQTPSDSGAYKIQLYKDPLGSGA
ncbi:pilus assembly protein TadG-related protein [Vibrio breoganii]|uniref:pilus assembly protein TadG-related protein n=1 Tax=Vibrio breoganii TaxID=553239 RepID=UPI000C81F110|nr:pilus assembly protein TadG-related protein [Vibrio breoganii]